MSRLTIGGIAALIALPFAGLLSTHTVAGTVALPDATTKSGPAPSGAVQTAVFAGGCFWGIEAVFEHVKGVIDAVSGYAGGSAQTADYETVSSGSTGHAESVKVTFDPSQVSY